MDVLTILPCIAVLSGLFDVTDAHFFPRPRYHGRRTRFLPLRDPYPYSRSSLTRFPGGGEFLTTSSRRNGGTTSTTSVRNNRNDTRRHLKQTIIIAKTANIMSPVGTQNNEKTSISNNGNGGVQNSSPPRRVHISAQRQVSQGQISPARQSRLGARRHQRVVTSNRLVTLNSGSRTPRLGRGPGTSGSGVIQPGPIRQTFGTTGRFGESRTRSVSGQPRARQLVQSGTRMPGGAPVSGRGISVVGSGNVISGVHIPPSGGSVGGNGNVMSGVHTRPLTGNGHVIPGSGAQARPTGGRRGLVGVSEPRETGSFGHRQHNPIVRQGSAASRPLTRQWASPVRQGGTLVGRDRPLTGNTVGRQMGGSPVRANNGHFVGSGNPAGVNSGPLSRSGNSAGVNSGHFVGSGNPAGVNSGPLSRSGNSAGVNSGHLVGSGNPAGVHSGPLSRSGNSLSGVLNSPGQAGQNLGGTQNSNISPSLSSQNLLNRVLSELVKRISTKRPVTGTQTNVPPSLSGQNLLSTVLSELFKRIFAYLPVRTQNSVSPSSSSPNAINTVLSGLVRPNSANLPLTDSHNNMSPSLSNQNLLNTLLSGLTRPNTANLPMSASQNNISPSLPNQNLLNSVLSGLVRPNSANLPMTGSHQEGGRRSAVLRRNPRRIIPDVTGMFRGRAGTERLNQLVQSLMGTNSGAVSARVNNPLHIRNVNSGSQARSTAVAGGGGSFGQGPIMIEAGPHVNLRFRHNKRGPPSIVIGYESSSQHTAPGHSAAVSAEGTEHIMGELR